MASTHIMKEAPWKAISDVGRSSLKRSRPWTELIDYSAISKPTSMAEAASRAAKNWNYFRMNYIIIVTGIVAFSLISHPMSLPLLLICVGAWVHFCVLRTEPLLIGGRRFSEFEVVGALLFMTLLLFFFTNISSLIISSLLSGSALVALHAAFRTPDDLFSEQDLPFGSSGFGLLSGFSSTTSSKVSPV